MYVRRTALEKRDSIFLASCQPVLDILYCEFASRPVRIISGSASRHVLFVCKSWVIFIGGRIFLSFFSFFCSSMFFIHLVLLYTDCPAVNMSASFIDISRGKENHASSQKSDWRIDGSVNTVINI